MTVVKQWPAAGIDIEVVVLVCEQYCPAAWGLDACPAALACPVVLGEAACPVELGEAASPVVLG